MQHEITAAQPLLDEKGNLREAGYCKKLLPIYRRRDIKAGALRIKEWDYYLVNNGHFAVALTIADNGYMGLDSISLLNLDEGLGEDQEPHARLSPGQDRPAGVVRNRGCVHLRQGLSPVLPPRWPGPGAGLAYGGFSGRCGH